MVVAARGGGETDGDFGRKRDLERFIHLMHRGSELLRDGRAREARDLLASAVAIHPEDSAARNLFALSLFQLGAYKDAVTHYRAVHLAHPDQPAAAINLALAHLKAGDPHAARPLLEKVVAESPDHRRAWGYLGICLEQLGLIEEAESAFVTGHFSSAARRLRDRHGLVQAKGSPVLDVPVPRHPSSLRPPPAPPSGPSVRAPAPAPTTPVPDAAGSGDVTTTPPPGRPPHTRVEHSPYRETQRPRDLDPPGRDSGQMQRVTSPSDADTSVREIPMENTVYPPGLSPRETSAPEGPTQGAGVVPLLDAALSSLLVVPHEATVQQHPSGLVLVGLEAKRDGDPSIDGIAARIDAVEAYAGRLERVPVASPRDGGPMRFRAGAAPFMRWRGTGQLVLCPLPGHRLFPVEMDADVAFLREELVVAFDHGLLLDLGRIRTASSDDLSIVRFRGDGVVVLELEQPFLSFDVKDESGVVLRVDSLIGWIGVLVPERVSAHDGQGDDPYHLRFTGEGTLLFRAPQAKWPV